MIAGTVNANYEITVPLPVRNAAGQEQVVEVIFDSGFNGALTLPATLVAGLGLAWHSNENAKLADGSSVEFAVYSAIVVWDGTPRPILLQAIGARPLLGTFLLIGFDLRSDAGWRRRADRSDSETFCVLR